MAIESTQISKYTQDLKFTGMNNVIDPAQLDWQAGEFLDGVNVDLNNTGGFYARTRRTSELPSIDTVEVDNIIYSAGAQEITIGNTPSISDEYSTYQFDTSITGGDIIEYFRGRLYRAGLLDGVAVVTNTKPMEFDTVDVRDYITYLSGEEVTMVGAVDDGIYIGTASEVIFLQGDAPTESGFSIRQVLPYGVIKGTRVRSNGNKVLAGQIQGTVIIFASHKGVCVGGNGGNLVNLSWNKVSYDYGTTGRAFIREENGLIHYIFQPNTGLTAKNIYTQQDIDISDI